MFYSLLKNKLSLATIITGCFLAQTSTVLAEVSPPNTFIYTGKPMVLTPKNIEKVRHLFKPVQESEEVETDETNKAHEKEPHEHIVWEQIPIDVVLPVGKERIITFPTPVQFGYDKEVLNDEMLHVQNNDGVLYLKAKQIFSPQRVQVKCIDTGKIILLDISARQDASDHPLDIVMNSTLKRNSFSFNERNEKVESNTGSYPITPVTLVRFAVQQLYSPKRLLTQPSYIYRVPMGTHKTLSLLLDKSAMALPLASWRGGDLFVTAILLRNLLSQTILLDPHNICGAWQAASFFLAAELAPRGNIKDTTTVFLVSKRSFADSLKECGL